MRMFNADGSAGKMCGNGTRCIAKYVYDHGMTDKTTISLETLSGIKYIDVTVGEDGKVALATVDMGEPVLKPELIPVKHDGDTMIDVPVEVNGENVRITAVSTGNPHCVVFVDEVKSLDLEKIGPGFENNPIYPERTNTEFIHVLDRNTIDFRVWERGSGETLACGTGACAAVMACILNKKTEDEVLVHLLGGNLKIRYDRATNHIFMTGPATEICTGDYPL